MLSLARPAVDSNNNPLGFTFSAAQVDAALHAPASQWLFRYELLNNVNAFVRLLTNVVDSSGVLTYDTTQQIKRTLTFTLEDDGTINYPSSRVKPYALLGMPTPYAQVVLADQPVAYYRMNDTGTTVVDWSGHGNNGTANRGVVPGVAPLTTSGDTAMSFDGITGYINVPHNSVFDCLAAVTMEAWIDPASAQTGDWISKGDNSGYRIRVVSSGDGIAFQMITYANGDVLTTDTYPLHAVYHVVGAADAAGHRIFVDGLLAASDTSPYVASDTSGPLELGADIGFGEYYTGSIGEVAIYNFGFNGQQAQAHYNAGIGAGLAGPMYAQFPLGVFLLSSPTLQTDASGVVTRAVQGYDLLQILASNYCTSRYTVTAGTNYIAAVQSALQAAGITTPLNLTPTTATLPTTTDWPLGTSYLTIVNALLSAINYNSLWFDPDGVCVAQPYLTPNQRASTYTFTADQESILSPVVQDSLDLFAVPNTWIATVSEPDQQVLTATYVNSNAQSPTSTVNRGFTIVTVDQNSTAPTQSALDQYVANLAYQDSQIYDQVTLDTALAPFGEDRDVYTIQYQTGVLNLNANYEEISYTFPLAPGGTHQHVVQKSVSV